MHDSPTFLLGIVENPVYLRGGWRRGDGDEKGGEGEVKRGRASC
jgi:hypothetical protein